jgi:hypothetical protein
MDEKPAHFFSRSIFNVAHYSLPFSLNFLADRTDSVGKRCGGKLGSNSARPFGHSSPKMQKSTIMHCKTVKKITCCARTRNTKFCCERTALQSERSIIMVSTRCGKYTMPEKTPPLPPRDNDNDDKDDNSNNGGGGRCCGGPLDL